MFARELRLRREGDVQRARARGKAWADGPVVFRISANPALPDQNRYTVVAGKKVGKAVQRNRARRVVREALRLRHPELRTGHDIVVIVRGTYDQLPDLATAQPIVDRIVRRAGLLAPSSGDSPRAADSPVSGAAANPANRGADRGPDRPRTGVDPALKGPG